MSFIPLASKLGPPSVAHNPEPFEYRRQRAGKPKSRLGCLTCKARRVKCDERKPVCVRCEKAQMVCNGYIRPELRRKMEATSSPLHPLLPRASTVTKPSQRLLNQLPRSFNGLPAVCGKNGLISTSSGTMSLQIFPGTTTRICGLVLSPKACKMDLSAN